MPAKSPRRHTDGSVTRAVAKAPRGKLAERRAEVLASLQHIKDSRNEPEPILTHESEQFELLPPGLDQLPDHIVRSRLPDPKTLWYSAAREA